jgi:hypothetical protein
MGFHTTRLAAVLFAIVLCVGTTHAQFDDSLPYIEDEIDAHRGPRLWHVGLVVTGVRHLGGTGLGIFGFYGDRADRFTWGGEAMMLHSGERRIPPLEAYNDYYIVDGKPPQNVTHVYEEVGMIGFGGSIYSALVRPPRNVGLHAPGVTLGISTGLMIETDRVGLQPSDIEQYYIYYGYGSSSDTDLSLRPYIRPQLIVTQGPLSIACGIAVFPKFASWNIGVTYGW